MIYLYDKAICKDLEASFNPDHSNNPVVRVADPDMMMGIAAQIQNDQITFPVVGLVRDPDTGVDTSRANFTRLHRGQQTVIDPETNILYYERVIPIKLSYSLVVLTTNTADMDEIVKELLFKYAERYFIHFVLPYECKRTVRFGITAHSDSISRKSAQLEYVTGGQLYRSAIPLQVDGAVLVSYRPVKLRTASFGGTVIENN